MVEIDGEKLMVSSSNFDDGSMIVSVGTTDFDNYGDSDFMEIMINKDGKIDYLTLPVGKDDYQRMYKIKPSHYGRMKTQNETNESAGGDFIRTDGDGKYAESFGAESLPHTLEDCKKRLGIAEEVLSMSDAVQTYNKYLLQEMGIDRYADDELDSESFGAEFAGYEDPISERQRYRIRKLGGRIDKAMTRSDASKYIKSLMAMPLHAETTDCSACQGWGWNEELDMVCDADGCIGGWVVPKKSSLLERGLELGAGMGMGMAGVAILFGLVGGTVGFAAETRKKRRD